MTASNFIQLNFWMPILCSGTSMKSVLHP